MGSGQLFWPTREANSLVKVVAAQRHLPGPSPAAFAVMGWKRHPLRSCRTADLPWVSGFEAIRTTQLRPRSNLLLRFEGRSRPLAWRALPFQLLQFADSPQRHWVAAPVDFSHCLAGRCWRGVHTDAR